ncbi:hypothetical protein IH824_16455, partial [candidate division KSB1 bacterium]|nr:hypothetical protein [candidate division KSB1 bacterium]
MPREVLLKNVCALVRFSDDKSERRMRYDTGRIRIQEHSITRSNTEHGWSRVVVTDGIFRNSDFLKLSYGSSDLSGNR